ncbi:hypothetical protein [Clostridium botulinum]
MKSKRKNIRLNKRNNNIYNRSKNIWKYEWFKYFISFILGVSTTLLGSFGNYKIQQKTNQILENKKAIIIYSALKDELQENIIICETYIKYMNNNNKKKIILKDTNLKPLIKSTWDSSKLNSNIYNDTKVANKLTIAYLSITKIIYSDEIDKEYIKNIRETFEDTKEELDAYILINGSDLYKSNKSNVK